MKKNLILKILFFLGLFVLVGSKIFAQSFGVASPNIFKLGVHTNPAVIHWKNPGIYFNPIYAKFDSWDKYNQDATTRRTQIYQSFSFGIKTESISTEIEQRKSIQEGEQIWSFNYNDVRVPTNQESSTTTIQGALGSDIVSFGYTDVGQGSDKSTSSGKTTTTGCCFNNKSIPVEIEFESIREGKSANNTYGFSFKIDNYYFGYAVQISEDTDSSTKDTFTTTWYWDNGSVVDGFDHNTDITEKKGEDKIQKIYSYAFAYYFDNEGSNAFKLEASLSITPENQVEARDSTYNSSHVRPNYTNHFDITYRFVDGFMLGLIKENTYHQKPSWEDNQYPEQQSITDSFFTGWSLNMLDIVFAYQEQKTTGDGRQVSGSVLRAATLAFKF